MEAIFVIIGLIVGGISAWFIQRYRFASKSIPLERTKEFESQIKSLELEKAQKDERVSNLETDLAETENTLSGKQQIEIELREKLVLCPIYNVGYSRFNFIRASAVVNLQLIPTCCSFLERSQGTIRSLSCSRLSK